MRIIVLGNHGPYPTSESPCSGYLVESDDRTTRLLLDCGSGVLMRLVKHIDIRALDAVVLSHLHYDHMSDMLVMHYLMQFNPPKEALKVYAPKQPEAIRALLKGANTDVRDADESFTVGKMRINCVPMRHPVPSNAIVIRCDGKKLVYTGDTNTADRLLETAADADLLLADAGLNDEDYNENAPHLSASLCGRLARDAHAGKLLLTHLNAKYTPAQLLAEARRYAPSAEFAAIDGVYEI